ncbi:uncharacterized protein LOC131329284 [Rhododendron vialii]|uniref:uncharacterized protein LOC131329284 n=1 Tax=Rhododendron vialii TaxID=182163 RepID=UPI00265FE093|nr:uncharacterized protein LOC131329284 [Rhododendron vialii]
MGSRGGGGGGRRRAENGGYWWVQPLKPLMEGPDLELIMQDEFISNKEETLMITTTTTSSSSSSNNNNASSSSSWEVLREWFRVHKNNNNNNVRPPNGNGNGFSIMSALMYYGGGGGGIPHIRAKRQDLRLLLGVLGCPLAPIPLKSITTNFPILHRPQIIKDIPIETSTAHYIIEQYLAATGCIKQQQRSSSGGESMMMIKNMYTTGTVKMICCETEISSSSLLSSSSSSSSSPSSSSSTSSGKAGGGRVKSIGTRSRGENGCFVLWQMSPGMWSLELVLGNGTVGGREKVIAGSNGKIVWRHTPWLGTHAAKGPHRPLRRIIQGLDPKSTANLFGEAQCLGEKRIGEEDCFVLRVAADRTAVMERNEGPAEVIRHVLYGYFSQKTGLLIYLEDSHLTRVQPITPPDEAANFNKNSKSNTSSSHNKETRTVYWETTIGSTIGDYREVDGVLIAHGGRTIATIFRFGEQSSSATATPSASTEQYYHYSRTRMEEIWRIDDVVFNVPGLSLDSFIPPSDIVLV